MRTHLFLRRTAFVLIGYDQRSRVLQQHLARNAHSPPSSYRRLSCFDVLSSGSRAIAIHPNWIKAGRPLCCPGRWAKNLRTRWRLGSSILCMRGSLASDSYVLGCVGKPGCCFQQFHTPQSDDCFTPTEQTSRERKSLVSSRNNAMDETMLDFAAFGHGRLYLGLLPTSCIPLPNSCGVTE